MFELTNGMEHQRNCLFFYYKFFIFH